MDYYVNLLIFSDLYSFLVIRILIIVYGIYLYILSYLGCWIIN